MIAVLSQVLFQHMIGANQENY